MKDMLNQVQDMLTVDAIMVAKSDLLTWRPGTDDSHVQQTIRDEEYNQVPVVNEHGEIRGLATVAVPDRTLPPITDYHHVAPAWLVSADTSVRRLIDILDSSRHPARFVFQEDQVVGLVTYADLNDAVARTALYLLISQLEIKLARLLRRHDKSSWAYVGHLSKRRQEKFAQLREEMAQKDVTHDPIEHFNLTDVFEAIRNEPDLRERLGFPSKSKFDKAKSGINKMRNTVVHSVRLVVDGVHGVASVNRRCARLEAMLSRL